MHSKIFQITTVKVTNEGRLTENTLTQGDGSFYDYCMEIEPDIRKQCIDILVNKILPSGMFELIDEDTLLYKGGAEQWKKEFVAYIQAKAGELNTENVQDWIGPVYQLEKALKNPLETAFQFYMDEGGYTRSAEESYEFMRRICEMEPGTTLYFGGVIDYHF